MRSRWCDPPSDILSSIADHLDPKLGPLHLRSICKSWRSSLPHQPLPHCPALTFPLPVPPIPSTSFSTYPHLSLHQRTLYLLTPSNNRAAGVGGLAPLSDSSSYSFLLKAEQIPNAVNNTLSLFNPLFCRGAKLPPPNSPINLLDYRITRVCESYVASAVTDIPSDIPIKKVVVARGFFTRDDFVALALKFNGDLLLWKFGDEQWTEIVSGRSYDDVICFNGKFYATAHKIGMLIMIDSRLKPFCLVSKLMYGNGACTSLVECNGGLYLVDRESDYTGVKFGVFKLDDKHRFWDYEPDLDGCVFFVGDDANFALSRKDYSGCIRDVVFFKDVVDNGGESGGFSQVFDVKTSRSCFVVDNERFVKFYWPPSSWFVGAGNTDCFR